ncbi:MAG: universal stress protein [Myxococcales bacterium]|nr:universal stress protein [Myxococcales bacterium]
MTPVRTLLVATDFSDCSAAALAAAAALAKTFGAEVHLLHAFELPVPRVMAYEVPVSHLYIQQARDAAAARLREEADRVAAAGVPVHTHLEEVPAATSIVRVAAEMGCDWIVVGTRGRTGLQHILLGSVAERVVRLAPCSVLTVKAATG